MNFFQDCLDRATAKGFKPDKWVINHHVAKALITTRQNNEARYVDVLELAGSGLELLGLPVRKSLKLDPMVVVLAEGKKSVASFTIPLVIDLTELGPLT